MGSLVHAGRGAMGEAEVRLRDVVEEDLDLFFANQLDPEANRMAGFTAKDPSDRAAFDRHWAKILSDPTVTNRSIVAGDVVGSIGRFELDGKPNVTYWIGKPHWGRGYATAALKAFLAEQPERPLYASVAFDNLGSRRVLEKCGFIVVGNDRGFANGRGEEIEEVLLILE
ncbi:MAG: GNAT family N-acetyltransferase [Actinomycetota bacterium]